MRALEGRVAHSRGAGPADASEHILDALDAAATATGVVLTTYSTSEAAKESSGEGRPVHLALVGGFHQVVRFLAHLLSLGRVGAIRDITVKRAAQTDGSRTVSASLVAVTSSGAAAFELEEIAATSGRDPFHEVTVMAAESSAGSGSSTAAATEVVALSAVAVDLVTVTGIVRAGDAISAVLEAPNRRTFVGRPNDRLLDATIESIDASGVTFMSLAASPPRPVRKSLGKPAGVVR